MANEEVKAKRSRLAMNYDDSDEKPDFFYRQIFMYLQIQDLCRLPAVNKQFCRLAKDLFSERYKGNFHYPFSFNFGSYESFECTMRRVLCNFGHLIKSMALRDRGLVYEIEMDAVSKYCAGTLEELELGINSPIDRNVVDSVKPLFRSLKVLQIEWKYFDGFIEECTDLKILKIYDFHECGFTRSQNIPNLEELVIVDELANIQVATNLLQLNTQIKKLSMNDRNANKAICVVASKMEKLEELILGRALNDYENIQELGKLKSLKRLDLTGMTDEFVPALEAMKNVPLEHLKLEDVPPNLEFINTILKFKTLTSLSLSKIQSPFDNFLIQIRKQLPLLKKLELRFRLNNEFPFSIDSLERFVQGSQNLNAIVIHTNPITDHFFNKTFYDRVLEVCSGLRSVVLYVRPEQPPENPLRLIIV